MNSLMGTAAQISPRHAAAAERVCFIQHMGQKVLLIDYSKCDAKMMRLVVEEGHRVISRESPNSVLTLNDVSGASFDAEAVAVLKSRVAANAPYVKRAAVVGISGLQALIYEAVQAFSSRRIPLFPSRAEALEWLVKD